MGLGLVGTAALLGGGLQAPLPWEPATAAWGCFFPFFPSPLRSPETLLSHRGQNKAHGSTWPLTEPAGTQTRPAAPTGASQGPQPHRCNKPLTTRGEKGLLCQDYTILALEIKGRII